VAFNEHPAGKAYTLQLAQDRSSDEQVERNFALLFIAVLVGGVVASALIAIVVTRRGLRPLREMTESLGRIGPDQLKQRIGSTGWPRELQPLAIAFDQMLKRSTIRSRGSRNFPPILRTNCERRSPICWAKRRLPSREIALQPTIARRRIHRRRMRTAFQDRGQFAFCRTRGCGA
jgi:Signal transduction histidine kinase, nitrate/nitrite-specific